MKISIINKFVISLFLLMMVGCGGGSSSTPIDESKDNDSGSLPNAKVTHGLLVDSFISGAILCEDINKNGICEANEQNSTQTTDDGNFSFANDLTIGSNIIIAQQGFHNGVPYKLKLSGIVDENGKIDIVSPLTTLQTKSLTPTQIATLLNTAGLDNITEDDIVANPLEGGINRLNTNDKLNRLHATLATYGMLKVISGSNTLAELNSTALMNSPEVLSILKAMVSTITNILSEETLNSIQAQTQGFSNPLFTPPSVSVNVIMGTAITMIDAFTQIGYDTCNQTDATDSEKVQLALAKFEESKTPILNKIMDIGMMYYAIENRATFEAVPTQFQSQFPQSIRDGLAMESNSSIVINIDDFAVTTQSTNVSNMIFEAYGDSSTKAVSTLIENCLNQNSDEPFYASGLDCDNDGGVVAFETPRRFKIAIKSLALINKNGEKEYLINKNSLEESVVFDISNPKELGDLIIPQDTYTHITAEIYYYWLDMQMYNKGEYTQFRVYMSDDNRTQATAGHHQGDITLTDENNQEKGWVLGIWKPTDAFAIRPEPNNPDNPLYASTKDKETNRQRGPFGQDSLWDDERLNPNDIYTITGPIGELKVTKESKIQFAFNTKNSWYWEDYNGDGIFGAGVHRNSETNITEAADGNATWSPLLNPPTIKVIY